MLHHQCTCYGCCFKPRLSLSMPSSRYLSFCGRWGLVSAPPTSIDLIGFWFTGWCKKIWRYRRNSVMFFLKGGEKLKTSCLEGRERPSGLSDSKLVFWDTGSIPGPKFWSKQVFAARGNFCFDVNVSDCDNFELKLDESNKSKSDRLTSTNVFSDDLSLKYSSAGEQS